MRFISAQRARWGIEPICTALQVAPSTYYAARDRQPSARQRSDQRLKREIARVHRANLGVYGIEKVWRQLNREGITVGRDSGSPVTPTYHPPNAFRGGTIERVVVDVSGDEFVDHEKEVVAWLARD